MTVNGSASGERVTGDLSKTPRVRIAGEKSYAHLLVESSKV